MEQAYENYQQSVRNTVMTADESDYMDLPERAHQSLVVFIPGENYTDETSKSEALRERAHRFVTSLNLGATMKADVYTLNSFGWHRGLVFADSPISVDQKVLTKVEKIAKKGGWVQYMILQGT